MAKKYKLIESDKPGLYRIQALRDFGFIRKGDVGGYVASEENLSQEGNCWIYDDAQVIEHATVKENAIICDNAVIKGNAYITGTAKIKGEACVCGDALVSDNVIVVMKAFVGGSSSLSGHVCVSEFAMISGCSNIRGNVSIREKASIHGHVQLCGNIIIRGNANIANERDYIVFKNWWSSGRYFTWTRSNDMWSVGCFYGTGEELVKKAYLDSYNTGKEYERIVRYVEKINGKKKNIFKKMYDMIFN